MFSGCSMLDLGLSRGGRTDRVPVSSVGWVVGLGAGGWIEYRESSIEYRLVRARWYSRGNPPREVRNARQRCSRFCARRSRPLARASLGQPLRPRWFHQTPLALPPGAEVGRGGCPPSSCQRPGRVSPRRLRKRIEPRRKPATPSTLRSIRTRGRRDRFPSRLPRGRAGFLVERCPGGTRQTR